MHKFLTIFFLCFVTIGFSQEENINNTIPNTTREIYIVSGIGWGFPMGEETKEVFTPKFSNILGANIASDKEFLFWYPSIDFLSFNYNQIEQDEDYPYIIKKSKSNYYNANFSVGIKKQFSQLKLYAFLGPGVGFMSEPRAEVNHETKVVHIKNRLRVSPTWRTGVGLDYQLERFLLFTEMSWSHNFRKVQGVTLDAVILFIGLKTDISRIAENVTKLISG